MMLFVMVWIALNNWNSEVVLISNQEEIKVLLLKK